MFILGNLIIGVTYTIEAALSLFTLLIVASAVISLLDVNPHNRLVQMVHGLTQPVFGKLRKLIPAKYWIFGHVDLVPLYTILIIILIQRGILPSIYQIGAGLN